ncbi:MAG: hypothetical protein M5U28_43340 [Sandaracinaceae bacterium]|nr:hypothetical protein [Sandaracinaceae bacterium]
MSTTSKVSPPSASLACVTSLTTKRASSSARRASERASSIATGEKSTPVTRAPRRAQLSVSIPKWHCRCTSDLSLTSPSSPVSIGSSAHLPARKLSTS